MVPAFGKMFSLENIYKSFYEFRRGKKMKADVAYFSVKLASNITKIHGDLQSGTYIHGGYVHFKIADPKPRDIHKASVQDRIVHHALYRSLYPFFDRHFIHDSYSCRINKGTHRALRRFRELARKESKNFTKTIWVLKGDIRKCFASVDHIILKEILKKHIVCPKTLKVLHTVIDSFSIGSLGKGIPLGNLTSQLFINIYLNELDHFVKRVLKVKYYIRYADDFVILSENKDFLLAIVPTLNQFLSD
jgi:RNA-directed DNA polymerase